MSRYLIRVEGELSAAATSAFPSLDSRQFDQSVVHGPLPDQCALAGVLDHLRRLGVDVVDVHRLPRCDVDELADRSPTRAGA
jgi:hypothetical protein